MTGPVEGGAPDLRSAYLTAGRSALDLVRQPAVAQSWDRPSALPDMTVGALACHLGSQLLSVRELILASEKPGEPIPLLEHYARARWVTAALDDEVNVSIRGGAQTTAEDGHHAVVEQLGAVLSELEQVLPDQSPDRPVLIPWQGWALSLGDFLVTRMMEITVHSDDLAISVGVDVPELPDEVLAPVLDLLTALAVRRHGQSAVVSALARAERAPTSIAAF